jgi:hypothetical protein
MSRALWVGAVTCGALLLPAGSAVATHMPGMSNGMACPHASGEGPDSLAAASPNDPATSGRAPSEAPLGAAGKSGARALGSKPATKPASQVTRPATQQVTKPATQVQLQRPATTTTQSAPATAVGQRTTAAVASQPVATPATTRQPRARRSAHRRPATDRPARATDRPAHVRRFNGLEPRVARPSATFPDIPLAGVRERPAPPEVAARARPPAPDSRRAPMPLTLVLGALALAGVAAALVVARRRGSGGAAGMRRDVDPTAPARADAVVEAELQEMISEANARALLAREETKD